MFDRVLVIYLWGILVGSMNLMAQDCNNNRYQSAIFNNSQLFSNVTYAKGVPELQFALFGVENVSNTDLVMDIRMPPNSDSVIKRPAIIWAHSGGFILGSKANDDMQALIDTFARRGFVTASIQYRLGVNIFDDVSAERAVYRGTQDASAAVRFFRENAEVLGVDADLIFMGGSSAGSVVTIHLGYVEDSERPASSFEQTNGSNDVIAEDLGAVHSHEVEQITTDNLSNPTSISVAGNQSGIPNALVACWGGIGDLDWLDIGGNTPEALFFHGLEDNVVFPDCQQPFQNLATMPILCGSEEIEIKLNAIEAPNETHLYEEEGHEFWGASNGDFGGDNQPDNVGLWQEVIDKIGVFLYDLIPAVVLPEINGLTVVCPDSQQIYAATELANSTYCWTVEGGTILEDNGANIEVLWGEEGLGRVSLQMTNKNGRTSELSELEVDVSPIRVKVKVLLEGMYVAGDLTTLNANNLLPAQQPYSQMPWMYSGNESVDLNTLPINVVDWVLIEARNPNNLFEVMDQATGLLLSNGRVVAANASSEDLTLCNLQHGESYHLVARHRNHLDVISSVAVTVPNEVIYDFSTTMAQAYGANQLVNLGGGAGFGMLLGDVNGDGVMNVFDFDALIAEGSLLNQYLFADFNFDGHVTVKDFNLYQQNASAIGVEEIRY